MELPFGEAPPALASALLEAPTAGGSEALAPLAADGDAPVLPAAPRFTRPLVARDRTRIVVLEYHGFGFSKTNDPAVLEPGDFRAQLEWLEKADVEIVRTSDVIDFYKGEIDLPELVAVIMIDDSLSSAKKYAFPELSKRKIPFTLALNTKVIEVGDPLVLQWTEVREMIDSGLCEVASHSHVHGYMDKMTDEQNQRELDLSRQLIEQKAGVRPRAFVYPFGSVSVHVQRLTEEAGYELGFAARGPVAKADSPRYNVPRTGIFRGIKLGLFPRLWQRD